MDIGQPCAKARRSETQSGSVQSRVQRLHQGVADELEREHCQHEHEHGLTGDPPLRQHRHVPPDGTAGDDVAQRLRSNASRPRNARPASVSSNTGTCWVAVDTATPETEGRTCVFRTCRSVPPSTRDASTKPASRSRRLSLRTMRAAPPHPRKPNRRRITSSDSPVMKMSSRQNCSPCWCWPQSSSRRCWTSKASDSWRISPRPRTTSRSSSAPPSPWPASASAAASSQISAARGSTRARAPGGLSYDCSGSSASGDCWLKTTRSLSSSGRTNSRISSRSRTRSSVSAASATS